MGWQALAGFRTRAQPGCFTQIREVAHEECAGGASRCRAGVGSTHIHSAEDDLRLPERDL